MHTVTGHLPTVGTSFKPLTFGARANTFADFVAMPVGSVNPAYGVTYGATSVSLTYTGTAATPTRYQGTQLPTRLQCSLERGEQHRLLRRLHART